MTSNSIIITLGFTSTGGGSVPVDLSDYMKLMGNWDMSTDQLPSGSLKGYAYIGINGPTTDLLGQDGAPLPNGVLAISKVNNADPDDSSQWSIHYGII